MDSIINLIIRGDDQGASSTLQTVSGRVGGLGGVLQSAAGFAVGGLLVGGIQAVTGALGGLFSEMVGGNAAFEQYETQFGVLLGSTEAAQQRMEELAQFGASTPFELPGVVQADMILQGFGLHSQEAAEQFGFAGEEIRTIAGDVASGTGSSFEEMAGLIGRFSAGATGEAISRMQELGITNRNELAAMGLEFSNSGQLLSPLPEAMEVVLSLMQDKYGGMMEAQSQTFNGMMSNLSDWKSNTLRTIGEPIFEVLKDKLQGLLTFLGSPVVQGALASFATFMADSIGGAIDFLSTVVFPAVQAAITQAMPTIQSMAATVAEYVVPGLQQLATWGMQIAQAVMPVLSAAWSFFMDNLNIILPVIGAVTAAIMVISSPILLVAGLVVGLATAWANNWGNIQGITQSVTSAISGVISSVLGAIQGWWQAHGDSVMTIVNAYISFVASTIETYINIVQTVITTVLTGIQSWWQAHGDSVMTLVSAYFSFVATAIQTYITIVQTVITTVLTAVQTFWAAHGDTIMAVAETAWTYIKDSVQVAVDLISGIISAFAFAVEGDWTAFGATLRTTFENAWTAMGAAAQAAVTSIVGIVAGLISDIITNFTNTNWNAVGQGVIDGIAGAISAGAGTIAAAAQGAAQAALDAAMGLLGIHSPSTVAADLVGRPFTQGIAVGATEEAPAAARQIQRGISGMVNELGTGGVGNRPRLVAATGATANAPQQVTVYHTYHVKIEDMRAMSLFLDYLQNIGGQTALEALA